MPLHSGMQKLAILKGVTKACSRICMNYFPVFPVAMKAYEESRDAIEIIDLIDNWTRRPNVKV